MKIQFGHIAGLSAALLLLSACGSAASPSTAPSTSVSPSTAPSSAAASVSAAPSASASASASASTAPSAPASAAASGAAASRSASASGAAASASAAGKKEEAAEPSASGAEEAAEGPPTPNQLPPIPSNGNKDYAPVAGADITKNGAAVSLRGSATAGQAVFVQNCVACHGVDGKIGIPNPGSDDGTVPPLNPIDPAFAASAKGNSALVVRGIDLFIQHGSRPSGASPVFSMINWGDQNKMTQQQIADVEAYVLQLNGISQPAG